MKGSMRLPFKLIIKIAAAAVCFALAALAGGIFALHRAALPPDANDTASARVAVPAGMTACALASELEGRKLIRSGRLFYFAARFPLVKRLLTGNGAPFLLKSGVYRLGGAMSLRQTLLILSEGEQEYIRVSIPEGLTISKIAARLEAADICPAKDFIAASADPALLAEYRIPARSFEGYLFPDTYFFIPGTAGTDALVKMADTFFERIKTMPGFADMDFERLHRTVILASIVEREYRRDDEAPLIASVFQNRITHNIGLYSCATVEYVITEIEGRPHPDVITYADLAIESPYNTYRCAGLPPGAISNPGEVALRAAANAPKTDYYFFRLTDGASGTHVFSKDFAEHVNQGARYRTKKTAGR